MDGAKYSLTWLHNGPSPNQMEFFHELGKRPEVRLRVLHCSPGFHTRPFSLGNPWLTEPDLAFDHKVLRGLDLRLGKSREFQINPEILSLVSRSLRNEVWLVGGYTIPTVQAAMWMLNFRKIPWILVSEPPNIRNSVRDFFRKFLLWPSCMGAKGVIVYGSRRRARYLSKFFPEEKIFVTPQYQNLSPLLSIPRETQPWKSDNHRSVRYFYAGRIEEYSGVDLLVRAFIRLAMKYPDVELEILGDGSQKACLERLVSEAVKPRVIFHGTVPREKVPGVFAGGDVFVHPNHGQGWGMVVNEALAAGMPVIASKAVGAAEELVVEGFNGFLLDSPKDEEGFYRKMEFFAEHRERLPEFSGNARKTAEKIDLAKGVTEFLGILDRLLQPV